MSDKEELKSLYQKIGDENIKKYGTENEKVLKIIINQYSDRTHFIYEILQNAEDAEAEYIKFHLEKDRLVIFHNGRPFNEKDIEGVCGIANGTKEDGTRIGHFGIGFKSVYCYTEKPQIYSGKYCFEIVKHIFPKEIPARKENMPDVTCMILPFDKEEVSIGTAFREIKDALIKKITAESILILNNISDIKIDIDGHPKKIEINKNKYPLDCGQHKDKVFSLSIQTTITNKVTKEKKYRDEDYLFFTDAEEEAVAVIFKVDGKELKAVKNSKIYAFFPTAKEAHQNFYIHAPFDTTPARDNFKEGAEYGKHNIALVNSIGKLLGLAFCWMKEHQYLSISGFNTVFPIYKYEEDDILYDLYLNSIEIIKTEEILPTNNAGEYKRINEICVPLWGIIVDTFNDDDLRLLRRNRNISWLAKEIATDAYRNLRDFLNKNFDLETLDWKDLVLPMTATFLNQKSLSWTETLMARIENYCVKKITYDSHYFDVSKIPFVRTTTGEQICARNKDGKLQVYLNNPDVAEYKIESSFLRNESIKSFYSRALNIPEYNIEQETVENILPKYDSSVVMFKTTEHMKENIEDLKIIKSAIYANPNILEKICDKYIVTDGKDWYKPSDLYIRKQDTRTGYELVKNIIKIKYLSENYFNSVKLDEEFFKKIGCNVGIRAISASQGEYLKEVKKYEGVQVADDLRYSIFCKKYIFGKLEWSFNYEGFPQVFEYMSKERSLEIARFLNSNVMNFDIKGELGGADNQHLSKNVDSKIVYSMLGLQICFEKWIYVNNDPDPHSPLEVDKDDILPEYRKSKHLMDALPFKDLKNPLSEWLNDMYKDKGDLELVRNLLLSSSPEKLVKVAEAVARNDAKTHNKIGSSIEDLIKGGDVIQNGKGKINDGLDILPITSEGKENREDKLDKELAESLDYKIQVKEGLMFTRRTSNKEERTFLENEYDGHCQICLTQINKYNGDHYFEAINIIKYSKLPERFANSSHLGWNSLCLCPNCAAQYNYCSKKISTFYDQVMEMDVEAESDKPLEIHIEMPQGEPQVISYTPRHFMALKEAFKIFSKEE